MAPLNPKSLRPAMMASPPRDKSPRDESPQFFKRKTAAGKLGVVKSFVDSQMVNQTLMASHNRKLSTLNDSANFAAGGGGPSNVTSKDGREGLIRDVDFSKFRRNIANA